MRADGAPPRLERRVGAVPPPLPPPRRLDILPLTLTKDGRLTNEAQLDRLTRAGGSATDCFVFCHGWLYDEARAREDATRFFTLLDAALAPLRDRIIPLHVALHWPSKPFADSTRSGPHGGLWPELERRMCGVVRRPHRPNRSRAGAGTCDLMILRELCAAEIARSPEEQAELDVLARGLANPTRGALSPFHALSYWTMKRRAGDVGERLGRECLAPLWRAFGRPPRLHLIGHSFGAKLATSAALGGARPQSLTLLLGAFSAFAFAPEVPGVGRPGYYYRVLAERLVDGPIVVLRSDHDAVLGTLYPAVTGSGEVDRSRKRLGRGATAATVATSALGAVGARGVAAPEIDLLDAQRIGIPRYAIVNVDGSRVVKARIGAHRDIYHPEIATLVGLAAGVLVGGPDGARPRPLDPLVAP